MFTLKDVSYQINNTVILHPTNLTFPPGKVTALLGHNGCGKSTLMKLLSRQYHANRGSIDIAGKPLQGFEHKSFARKVSYLPQHPPVTDGVTVRELVSFGRYPWKGAFGQLNSEDHQAIEKAIEHTGLMAYADRFVATLSGGERQRAWVAMLLAQQSECLLLDEPTSALDVHHQYELLEMIRELNQRLNLTVVIVLHDINMAARFSDHIIALKSGQVIAQGNPEQIMQTDVLKSIYGMDLALFRNPANGQFISYIP